MARRRPVEPDPIQTRHLSLKQIDRGIEKLGRRIGDISKLESDGVHWKDGRKKAVETHVRDTVRDVFGAHSPVFQDFEHFHISRGGNVVGQRDIFYQACYQKGIPDAIALLEGLIGRLEERKLDYSDPLPTVPDPRVPDPKSRKIFLVHGHDEAAKEATARFLTQLNLEPIILHEKASGGRTVIEKFEKYADVSFAVVLLTPDDVGAAAESPEETRPRARQNVVFELGFFIGKLGRDRVCALHKGDTEILSDYKGVVFVPFDPGEAWKLLLAREIRAAGVPLDMNRLV